MRNGKWWLGVTTAAVLVSSTATAGGLMCLLTAHGLELGRITGVPKPGVLHVSGGAPELNVGPDTAILRVQRIDIGALRPGDRYVARRGSGAAAAVVVFAQDSDVVALTNLMPRPQQGGTHTLTRTAAADGCTLDQPCAKCKRWADQQRLRHR